MRQFLIQVTDEEFDWLQHAASLIGISHVEYTRRAINASLRKSGVDAVLLSQSDDDQTGSVPPSLSEASPDTAQERSAKENSQITLSDPPGAGPEPR